MEVVVSSLEQPESSLKDCLLAVGFSWKWLLALPLVPYLLWFHCSLHFSGLIFHFGLQLANKFLN